MKKIYTLPILLFFCCLLACKEDEFRTKEEDGQELTQLFNQINGISISQACDNEADWKFVAYGSKACGGPIGHIAYSIKIDTTNFLKLVEEFTVKQNEFNVKWGAISNCAIEIAPKKVICENGKPKFE